MYRVIFAIVGITSSLVLGKFIQFYMAAAVFVGHDGSCIVIIFALVVLTCWSIMNAVEYKEVTE